MYIDGIEVDLQPLLRRWGIEDCEVSGNELNCFCPFRKHSSGGRKFYINQVSGLWQCKVCSDKKGNFTRLVMLLEDIDREDAKEFLKSRGHEVDLEKFGEHIVDVLYEQIKPLSVRSDKRLRREAERVMMRSGRIYAPYWKQRGLSKRSVSHWDLRVGDKRSAYPYIIPIYVGGKLSRVIRRTRLQSTRMKYYFQKGFKRSEILFGLDEAIVSGTSTLVICEGPLDCITIWQVLSENDLLNQYVPVALLGDFVSKTQAKLIAQFADEVILFFDNDEGGKIATKSALDNLKGVFISLVDYGKYPAKDPGELTDDEIITMIKKAKPALSRKVRDIYGES